MNAHILHLNKCSYFSSFYARIQLVDPSIINVAWALLILFISGHFTLQHELMFCIVLCIKYCS